jgi:hypothetical protein
MEVGNLAQWASAVMSAVVATLAVWGDKVRTWLAGPQIELFLRAGRGDLNFRADSKKALYHHIVVRNRRSWSPAKDVRLQIVGLAKRGPDGTFFPESLVTPLQLTWAFPFAHEQLPTVASTDTCDLGFLDEEGARFRLTTYVIPNNFRGFVAAGKAMRVEVVASASNFSSREPLTIEVSWDGKWTDLEEMQRHLVIKEVAPGDDPRGRR